MLNIDDIRERISNFPVPSEIDEIRSNITERFKDLEFVEDGHKYYLHDKSGDVIEMSSVSSVCHKYETDVDWETILERKAIKDGIDPDVLRRQWREKNLVSTSNGTLTHLFAEAYMWFFMGKPEKMPDVIARNQYEDGYLIPYGKKQEAVAKFYDDLQSVPSFYPVMPETKVYIRKNDNKYGIRHDIAGTFDALFTFRKKSGKYVLSVFDWKTNMSIENEWNTKNNVTLLPPFDSNDFIDEPKSVYTIQLSLYSVGLSQLGYDIVDRKLIWLTDDGNYHKISVPDVSDKLIMDLSK